MVLNLAIFYTNRKPPDNSKICTYQIPSMNKYCIISYTIKKCVINRYLCEAFFYYSIHVSFVLYMTRSHRFDLENNENFRKNIH